MRVARASADALVEFETRDARRVTLLERAGGIDAETSLQQAVDTLRFIDGGLQAYASRRG